MRPGIHDWTKEFRDEDKWLFLTKRQWLILGLGALVDFLIVSFIVMIGLKFLLPVIFIVCGLIFIAFVVVAFIEVPDNWYLFGSGLQIEKILLRLLLKQRKSEKKIYTKHYDNDYKGW